MTYKLLFYYILPAGASEKNINKLTPKTTAKFFKMVGVKIKYKKFRKRESVGWVKK